MDDLGQFILSAIQFCVEHLLEFMEPGGKKVLLVCNTEGPHLTKFVAGLH
jgi:hypothetical protein